ncbi:uncharacterized protein VP01_7156g1 [Puccinia sorghi]|uniref:DDE Tnp4 domain-containing protein n=1 Tax=Puccinia sorghi TaxID=27349 RepID=A0A0L6UFL0_9BASI|nr:uncharacterized protein VP01_7156g1 [Puccinia sorghi]
MLYPLVGRFIGISPDITKYLFQLDTRRFKQEFRISLQLFESLLSLIQNHPVFYRNSNVPQRPVRNQLMQLGCFPVSLGSQKGPLSCIDIVWWRHYWLLKGQSYCSWPNCDAQVDIASGIAETTGFKNCVGFFESTLIPLAEKPLIDAHDYYSRKGLYGLATLVDGRVAVTTPASGKTVTSICRACVVLHNFLLNDDSPLIDCDSYLNNPLAPMDNNNLHARGVNSSGNQHREKVFQGVLRHLELA